MQQTTTTNELPEGYLSFAEAAQRLDINTAIVYQARTKGHLQAQQVNGLWCLTEAQFAAFKAYRESLWQPEQTKETPEGIPPLPYPRASRIPHLRQQNGVPDGYYTVGEAAKELGIAAETVRRHLDGQVFGRITCYSADELDAYRAGKRKSLYTSKAPKKQEEEEDNYPPPLEILPALHGYLSDRVRTAADVGMAKKLDLSSGGMIYLCYDMDMFAASEAERSLLFTLIDAIKRYEQEREPAKD